MITQRQSLLVQVLLNSPHPLSVETLALYFKVSSKTIRNELKAINHEGALFKLKVISKPALGIYIQDKQNAHWSKLSQDLNYINPQSRQYLIFLIALTHSKISVQACAERLYVSRQTLTRDIGRCKQTFQLSSAVFKQTTHGFMFYLDEPNLRHQLIQTWLPLLPIELTITYLSQSFPHHYQTSQQWIKDVQEESKIELEPTSYTLVLVLTTLLMIRCTLNTPSSENLILDDDAQQRLQVIIQSSRLSIGSMQVHRHQDELATLLLHSLCNALHINVNEEDVHIQSLLMHLKATLQRIKHQSFIENPMIEDVRVSLSLIYDVTQQCLLQFEKEHQLSFNDHEISYIVMHCGVLIQSLGTIDSQLKIAIVCPHGSATSQLLMNRLQHILPHHHLHGPYSLNEFEALRSHTIFDTVITTVALGIKNEIVVHPLLNLMDQDRIEKSVWNATYQKQCERVLQTYHVNQHEHLTMGMMLKPHQFQFSNTSLSWRQAIHKAAQPLLEEGRIKPSYIEKMIWAVDHLGPYMVILPHIAFVHAAPDDGVIHNGISCLRLHEPLSFGDKKSVEVKVIFVIASRAKEDMGLVKLIHLCEHESNMNTLLYSNSIQDIFAMKGSNQ